MRLMRNPYVRTDYCNRNGIAAFSGIARSMQSGGLESLRKWITLSSSITKGGTDENSVSELLGWCSVGCAWRDRRPVEQLKLSILSSNGVAYLSQMLEQIGVSSKYLSESKVYLKIHTEYKVLNWLCNCKYLPLEA
jgi:hypothetical protein